MGSNIGSDSASEADTVEPMNKSVQVTEVPDSDVEDTGEINSTSPNAAKLKGIIEQINADSDDDDLPDDPVDFGEEEEDDEPPPAANPATSEEQNIHDKGAEQMELGSAAKNSQPKTQSKKSNSPSSKSRSKKEPKPGPEKTIKKQAAAAKGKSKIQKKTTTTKKSAPLLKSTGKASSSQKVSKSREGSPKSKKTVARTEATTTIKGSPKGSKKEGKKDNKKDTDKTKPGKPVKTIDKSAKKGSEKTLLKKNKTKAPTKTFSKKTKTDAKEATETKTNKAKPVKRSKNAASSKQKTTKKGKSSKAEKENEEEENEDMEVTSDAEMSDADSSDADSELLTHTPNSKLPIIGSLACSSRDTNAQALLDHAVQQLGKYRVVEYGADSDVHLHAYIISSGTKRGWGVLQALVSGSHLVSEDWLSSSISEGSWQPMSAFLSDRFGKSPRSVTGTDAHNQILEGLRIKVACEGQDARSVRKLVTLCGARVAETRVDLIVNDTGKIVDGGTNVTKKWLADSVESGVAVEYQPYLVESN